MRNSGHIPLRFQHCRSAHFSLPIRKKADVSGVASTPSSEKKLTDRPDRDVAARHRHR